LARFQENGLLSADDVFNFRAFVRPKDEADFNRLTGDT
jgi:hypothetical protein